MFFTIYKTTNLIDGISYIGMHQTDNLDDGYLGSGLRLRNAISKYGRQNFKKEILHIFDNSADMVQKEKELVTEEVVNSPYYYNMMIGGKGGRQSDQSIAKIRNKTRDWWSTMTEEERQIHGVRISAGCNRERRRELILGANNHMYGKKHTTETREKLRKNSAKRDHSVLEWQHQDGRRFVGSMVDFYTEYNLCRAWASRVRRGIKPTIKGWRFVRELEITK